MDFVLRLTSNECAKSVFIDRALVKLSKQNWLCPTHQSWDQYSRLSRLNIRCESTSSTAFMHFIKWGVQSHREGLLSCGLLVFFSHSTNYYSTWYRKTRILVHSPKGKLYFYFAQRLFRVVALRYCRQSVGLFDVVSAKLQHHVVRCKAFCHISPSSFSMVATPEFTGCASSVFLFFPPDFDLPWPNHPCFAVIGCKKPSMWTPPYVLSSLSESLDRGS